MCSSDLFHTPNVDLAALQCRAARLPLITQLTSGEKEKELEDLENVLQKAKELHSVQGVVGGALHSSYQRDRIKRVCDKLGLKLFAPLWHMDQEQELRGLLKEGFEIILSSVAAEGLDHRWIGRVITEKDVDKLVQLHEQLGLNVAGEGGEFESLVLYCPLFSKKLHIVKQRVAKEGDHRAQLLVEDAVLTDCTKR